MGERPLSLDDLPNECASCSRRKGTEHGPCSSSVTYQGTGETGGIVLLSKPCKCPCNLLSATRVVRIAPPAPAQTTGRASDG